MVKVYATGMGPLPSDKPRLIHGSCSRTEHFVGQMLEAGHEVCLVAARITDRSVKSEQPLVRETRRESFTYYLVDEEKKYNDPAFHQEIVDAFRPDAAVAITSIGCRPFSHLSFDAPLWADIHGYVMGEAQLTAEYRQDDGYIYAYWKRYDGAIYRADRFSATSEVQRLALIGELGALGRLNRYTTGYEFVEKIPIAAGADEPKKNGDLIRGKLVPEDAFVVLWLGGYNHWCDPKTLFEGLSKAMEKERGMHFVSTGGRIDGHDEKSFERLRLLVEQSPFRDRFHFQGWVDSEEIPNYLLESNVGISIDRSCYEAIFGARHRITEMLRAGLPVITTQITEVSREAIRAGAALGCRVEDPEDLSEKLLFAISHPGKILDMGILGRQLFVRKYTEEKTIQPLLEWLQDPVHAPDWGKDIPHRENLLYEKLRARPLHRKALDFVRSEMGKWRK